MQSQLEERQAMLPGGYRPMSRAMHGKVEHLEAKAGKERPLLCSSAMAKQIVYRKIF